MEHFLDGSMLLSDHTGQSNIADGSSAWSHAPHSEGLDAASFQHVLPHQRVPSGSHGSSASLSQIDADIHFFAAASPHTFTAGRQAQQHSHSSSSNALAGNTLGLDAPIDHGHASGAHAMHVGMGSTTALSAPAMGLSHSMPSFDIMSHHRGDRQAGTGHEDAYQGHRQSGPSGSDVDFIHSSFGFRRPSVSNVSDSSASHSGHGHGSAEGDSQSPTTMTPLQSPIGLVTPLSAMSGLALSTPASSYSPTRAYHAPQFDGARERLSLPNESHGELLSLSQGRDAVQPSTSTVMGPPALVRRSSNLGHAAYTGGASMVFRPSSHSLLSTPMRDDDVTPVPSSSSRFEGQGASSQVASMAATPFTPTFRQRAPTMSSFSSSGSGATPGHSHSSTTTPDDHFAASHESPFHRNDSHLTLSRNALSRYPYGEIPLEAMWAEKEHQRGQDTVEHSVDKNWSEEESAASSPGLLSIRQLDDGTPSFEQSQGSVAQEGATMSRTASAPTHPHLNLGQHLFSPHYNPNVAPARLESPVTYPSSCSSAALPSPSYDDTHFGAAMTTSRSMSNLKSSAAISPLSLVDGKQRRPRAFSSAHQGDMAHEHSPKTAGPTRTPRSRARNSGPPPLIVSSADKSHICHCGKRFKRMEHLKRHNRTHTQERPHRCPFPTCGKMFGRTDNLAQHLKTHYRGMGPDGNARLMALAKGEDDGSDLELLCAARHGNEPRHDPHAAASAAAASTASKVHAAAAAAAVAAAKRRSTISGAPHDNSLGGPITLTRPQAPQGTREPLVPSGSVSANTSPRYGGHPY